MLEEYAGAAIEFSDSFDRSASLVMDLFIIRNKPSIDDDLLKIEIIAKNILEIVKSAFHADLCRGVEALALLRISNEYVNILYNKTKPKTFAHEKIVTIKIKLQNATAELKEQRQIIDLLATPNGRKRCDLIWRVLRSRKPNLNESGGDGSRQLMSQRAV